MVRYFSEGIKFSFKNKLKNNRWLKEVAFRESRKIGDINIIFCSDSYLLDVNIRFLHHNYYTDIITFDYCNGKILSGDLFISIDSVRENAEVYGSGFENELNRVMVHGILHLIGYDDHSKQDIEIMRGKENLYLDIRSGLFCDGRQI